MSRQHGHGSGLSLTILRQFWMPHEGMEVNLRQAQNVSFFPPPLSGPLHTVTHIHELQTDTHPLAQAQNLMRNSSASFSMCGWVGVGGAVRETNISLERD